MTSRDRRALVVGAATLVAALVVRQMPAARGFVVTRLREARERSALADRARRLLASAPAMRDTLALRAEQVVALTPLLFAGSSAPDAAAAFSARINGAAVANRMAIARVDVLPDSALTGFLQVQLRVRAETDLEGLAGFLASLERGPQLVTIPRLAIENERPGSDPQRLRVDLVVTGWALAKEAP